MIVVIADDFSGAAELAGAAASLGLSAEVQTEFAPSDAEVVAVTTETRLCAPAEAEKRVAEIAREVVAAKPDWIFKKTDSVLRGSVALEASAIAHAAGLASVLLIPANPGKGRVIRRGKYFIGKKPLHKTDFANDPDHPRTSSVVEDLLGRAGFPIRVPDAGSRADLDREAAGNHWALSLPAGGVEFFEACLRHRERGGLEPRLPVELSGSKLLICGSLAAWNLGRAEVCRRNEIPFASIDDGDDFPDAPRVMLAIGEPRNPENLTERLADRVEQLLKTARFENLLLEGGATAFAVLERLCWARFEALPAPTGVAILKTLETGQRLVVKPGSYDWPAGVWP